MKEDDFADQILST